MGILKKDGTLMTMDEIDKCLAREPSPEAKLARDAAVACIEFIKSEGQFRLVRDSEVQALLMPFFAQARAPLVDVVKQARRAIRLYNKGRFHLLSKEPISAVHEFQLLEKEINAALTDTGEKPK